VSNLESADLDRVECLFIGGCMDGQRHWLRPTARHVSVPVPTNKSFTKPSTPFAVDDYVRDDIAGFPVFHLVSMSKHDAAGQLLLGYRESRTVRPCDDMLCPATSHATAHILDVLTKAIQEDSSYAWAWQLAIAVQLMNERVDHQTANRAAARVMRSLFGADVTTMREWKAFSWAKQQEDP
jgi:hypothetical protein